jgi:ABC-2 type transport system permease protein
MNHIWKTAIFEYRRNVFKKSFILLLISVPFFIVFSIGIGLLMESTEENALPVGIVDQAGVFADAIELPKNITAGIVERNQPVQFIHFASEDEASASLIQGETQAYYIIPADYSQNRRVEEIYIKKPGKNAERQFYDYLQVNLVSNYPSEIANRVSLGTYVTVRSLDGQRVVPSGGPTFGLLMPIFFTMAILFMILMSSGYTMSAVADEKENRTIEVLVTSTSTTRLITGKILGIIAIGITLLVTWGLVIFGGALIAQQMGISWFQDLSIDWRIMTATLLIGIPAYALTITLMTAIGAMVTTVQEGQSVSSIFIILHLIPLYISVVFLKNPDSPIGIVLSIIPFTALMTIGMRNIFIIVPTWQIIASMIVQFTCFLGALWLAGKALRFGMLRYGQRLTWQGLFKPTSQ